MNGRLSTFASAFILVLLSGGAGTPAHAIPIAVSFQAGPFQAGAPTDPVVGSLVYDAVSTTSNINSLISINLTIAGHTYTFGEVGFVSPFGSDQFIYGLINGTTIVNGTNDFTFRWNEATLVPSDFTYSAVGGFSNIFDAGSFPQFGVTAVPRVPEPSSLALLVAGVVALSVVLGRRSRLL